MDELLLNTNNHYGQYLAFYMTSFVIGENNHSDGPLLYRMKKVNQYVNFKSALL
ncbi:hypothetical protein ACIQW7_16535 [Peribacillus simplex]|uniref:hypothetical protein n=1 Tax=Peribacillus TaxID=2675229 RepID=UPI00315AE218